MNYSDRLAEACIANGADRAAVGAWPDFKRETYLYDAGVGLPPRVEGKPYYMELQHEAFDEFDDAGWEWKEAGKFVVGCFEHLYELEAAVRRFDPDTHMNTNDGCPPAFNLIVFAGTATRVRNHVFSSLHELADTCREIELSEGEAVVLEYSPAEETPSHRGAHSSSSSEEDARASLEWLKSLRDN